MSISEIRVHTGRLNTDAQSLRQALAQTRGHIQDLTDRMEAMNRSWDGPAKDAMQKRFLSDREGLLDLCNHLEELISDLEADTKEYDTCNNQVASQINSLIVPNR